MRRGSHEKEGALCAAGMAEMSEKFKAMGSRSMSMRTTVKESNKAL